ncbi:hypothetical protein Tco_0947676 [Tanacetum coccineum]
MRRFAQAWWVEEKGRMEMTNELYLDEKCMISDEEMRHHGSRWMATLDGGERGIFPTMGDVRMGCGDERLDGVMREEVGDGDLREEMWEEYLRERVRVLTERGVVEEFSEDFRLYYGVGDRDESEVERRVRGKERERERGSVCVCVE